MGNVGLFLIGAVLLVNGLGLLGRFNPRSAVPLNLFVGGIQVILPTIGLVLDYQVPGASAGYASLYLFGFTYLWVALDTLRGDSGQAFGAFSGFVAVIAVIQGFLSLRTDPPFAIAWWLWAFMWGAFFLLQYSGVKRVAGVDLAAFTGWLLIIGGQVSATVPALLRLNDAWPAQSTGFFVLMSAAGLLTLALSYALAAGRIGVLTPPTAPSEQAVEVPDAAETAPATGERAAAVESAAAAALQAPSAVQLPSALQAPASKQDPAREAPAEAAL